MGTPTAAVDERRTTARRQPTLGTVCRLADPDAAGRRLGLVWNLSAGGVSLLLPDRLERGSRLTGELTTADDGFALPVTMRVAHVVRLATGDYLVGGQFDRTLDAEEMRPFLAGTGAPR